jgi:ribose transport system substrate-binding protein
MKKTMLLGLALLVAASLVFTGCAKKQAAAAPAASSAAGTTQAAAPAKQYRVGFAALCEDNDFGVVTAKSVKEWMAKPEYNWMEVYANNNYNKHGEAVQIADQMVTQKVDGFIDFQVDAGVAPRVAQIMKDAKIPLITIDCPHPGVPFFGANNKEAGLIVGHALADKAIADWGGKVDAIVLVGAPGSGEVVDLRMNNIATGIIEKIPAAKSVKVYNYDGKSEIETSQKNMADILSAHPEMHHILIGALNDQSGLGCYNAVVASNRQKDCFIGSHGCDAPAKNNLLNNPENCWIGSCAYFPERYGEYVVPLMAKLLKGEQIPMFNYPDHVFIDKSNIDKFYNKDGSPK